MPAPDNIRIGQEVPFKVDGRIVYGKYLGWKDDWNMAHVEYEGRKLYRKLQSPQPAAPAPVIMPSAFHVNQRFVFIERLCDMVVSGRSRSAIISGSGGLGKTYTVMSRLQRAKLVSVHDYKPTKTETRIEADGSEIETDEGNGGDYIVVKGYSTSKALYRLMWENRDRIIVFDDCDSVWMNDVSVGLLKAALDSYDVRRITWLAEIKNEDDDLPQSFEFQGKVIFVSNLSLQQLDQAVLSRCLYVDVSMTPDEKIERIRTIMPGIRPDLSMEIRSECLSLMEKLAHRIGDLNIRTFLKCCEIREGGESDWASMAEYMLTAV